MSNGSKLFSQHILVLAALLLSPLAHAAWYNVSQEYGTNSYYSFDLKLSNSCVIDTSTCTTSDILGYANVEFKDNGTAWTPFAPPDLTFSSLSMGTVDFYDQDSEFAQPPCCDAALNFTTGYYEIFDPITQIDTTVYANGLQSWSPTTVPVPAAAWLFSSGLIGLIGFARRKARV